MSYCKSLRNKDPSRNFGAQWFTCTIYKNHVAYVFKLHSHWSICWILVYFQKMKYIVDMCYDWPCNCICPLCCRKSGTNLYEVTMDDAAILAGPYGLPVEIQSKFNLELLYVFLSLSLHFIFCQVCHCTPSINLDSSYEFTTLIYKLLTSLSFSRYADNKLRITKGYKNTIFVHVRVEGANKK